MSVHTSAQGDEHRALMQIQRNLPTGNGFGYRLRAGAGEDKRREAAVLWQHGAGTMALDTELRDRSVGHRKR